jgi:hypothetical protein
MITERATFNQQPHCNCGCVPSRCRKALEKCFGGGVFIQMHRLRVKLRCEALDVWGSDPGFTSLELHPNGKVVKPLDHGHLLPTTSITHGDRRAMLLESRAASQHLKVSVRISRSKTAALRFPQAPSSKRWNV